MKFNTFLCLLISSVSAVAAEIRPFEATYQITRGGDPTGQQTTVLSKIDDTHWSIVDTILGTNGLASFVGFKRTESTEFKYTENGLVAIKHDMLQKAALSKRKYHFELDSINNQYTVNYKDKQSLLEPQLNSVISSQLLPIAIAIAACEKNNLINFTVLKNKNTSPYQFELSAHKKIHAKRIYPVEVEKQTISWLDETKQCLPIKNIHEVKGEPTIETTLTHFKWL